ncbi:DUF2971 domain-containing protein [Burkholderia cepacia]|uniref:DUF2971 domain-containing protein n=1 Tax=Burkholderia cepacia TaxID=292 RepID=A0ABM6P2T6_BURCE|nr:DUF2971 domain-containing protein [Burkholderia cepacia]AIO28457.1 hypothetical protein DM41_6480 [Burkholderia cepacia ATCC 25416]ASE98104.1 DUF2971 domain-containing protein [Burkholderia cepacia]ATF80926.1 DUF2971 domain-containing protein [Burkholderia cepacia]MCA8465792.1 DUF2971 domain-containing protein [Burkholderia cepacia]MDN7765501.1 DUF2971 domain-containing protein [Burkholderia cepacia]
MKLYRYRQINTNTFGEIAERRAWFSKYSELNDPFEGRYINKSSDSSLDVLIQTFRVCCFSKRNDNLLLWAHYAENHRGVCLEYDIPDETFKTRFFPINYSASQPVIDRVNRYPVGDVNSGSLLMDMKDAVFLTKSEDWKYEEEWRMLRITERSEEKGEKHEIPGNLSAIYFGLHTSEAARNIITKLASSTSPVEFWQASLRAGYFSLEFARAEA